MKIVIANQDRTAEWEPLLQSGADRLVATHALEALPPELSALSLREARSESEFLDRWITLARRKSHVDTLEFDLPRRAGVVGALLQRVRLLLWKVLRYQHNRVVSRQNLVNSHLVAAVEFQADEIRRLQARLDDLERRKDGTA